MMDEYKKDAEKWRRFWSVYDQLGVYPQKYNGKDRDAYGEGWNDCQVQLLAGHDLIDKFYRDTDKSLPDKIQKLNDDEILWFNLDIKGWKVHMGVNCNDIFYWACGDVEEINIEEIQSLYDARYDEDGNRKKWGSTIWACLHRGSRPQHPIEDDMRKDGCWNEELESLPIRGNTG